MSLFYNKLRDLILSRRRHDAKFAEFWRVTPAEITTEGGSTTFDSAGVSWTWILLHSHPSGKVAAINPTALTEDGTPVLAARNPRAPYRWAIIGHDPSRIRGDTQAVSRFETGAHGENHQVADESSPGPDPVYIFQPMLKMLKTEGDGATLTVSTYPYVYTKNGMPRSFVGQDTDLTSAVPASGYVRYVLLYLDRETNSLEQVAGGSVVVGGPLPIPVPVPPAVAVDARESAWITLTGGQTAIVTATDIFDGRDFLDNGISSVLPSATAPGQVLIADETLNWIAATPVIDENGYWMSGDDDELVWE